MEHVEPRRNPLLKYDLTLWVAGLALLVGSWLRFATVSDFDFFGDEFHTIKWALYPVSEVMSRYGEVGLTMHLYILLVKGWMAIFGSSPLAVKMPSLLAGIALIPMMYWLGRRWIDKEVGSIAAMMVALSTYLIWWSRMARVYALLIMLVIVAMLLFLRAVRCGKRNDLIWLGVLHGLMLTVSLNTGYIFIVQGIVLLLEWRYEPRFTWRGLLGFGASYALAITLALLFYSSALAGIAGMLDEWGSASALRLDSLINVFQTHHPALPLVMLAFLAFGIRLAWQRNDTVGRLLIVWAVLPLFYYVLMRTRFPDHALARFLLPTLPAQILLIGLGLMTVLRRILPELHKPWHLGLGVVFIVGLFVLSPNLRTEPFREWMPFRKAVLSVQDHYKPGDLVTANPGMYLASVDLYPELETGNLSHLAASSSQASVQQLFILSRPFPKAHGYWEEYFELEDISGPPYRGRLLVLRSPPLAGNADSLRTALRVYLTGFVDAANEGAMLHRISFRHHLGLSQFHSMLAQIAQDAGDEETAQEHINRRDFHREQQSQAQGVR